MAFMLGDPDIRAWLSNATKRRITAIEIAEILGVSRTTANARISRRLTADDVITVCRALEVNPVDALIELGYLTIQEVMNFMDSDGKLVDTAESGELAIELARRLNPAKVAPIIDELTERRTEASRKDDSTGNVQAFGHDDGTVIQADDSIPHAVDSSPDETQLRGEDPIE